MTIVTIIQEAEPTWIEIVAGSGVIFLACFFTTFVVATFMLRK